MRDTLNELILYLKKPQLERDTNIDFNYRLKKFGHLLLISLATALLTMPFFTLFEELNWINFENHKNVELMEQFSKPVIFFLIVIVAPLLEELIFRAPLTSFKKKNQFKIGFYIIALIFGFIHITNYQIDTTVLVLSPILVLPQILLGFYLGYIRVKFSLGWSIALHAVYNGVLSLFTFVFDLV